MAVYEFDTSMYQNIAKLTDDILAFTDGFWVDQNLTATRWEADGRRITSGNVVFTTNVELPPHYIEFMDITHVPGTTDYSITTAMLANMRKCSDDMRDFFWTVVQNGYQVVSISIDGRALVNGKIRVTTNNVPSVNVVFGIDMTRIS